MALSVISCFYVCFYLFVLFTSTNCAPELRMRIVTKQSQADTLMLPSNATSIRDDITDNFSCENKTYGYYADVDNECQIFHVCLPVTYSDGKNQTFRWSFICPESTVFNQENFVCVREEDMTIKCDESEGYYGLNDNFGNKIEEEEEDAMSDGTMTEEDGDTNMAAMDRHGESEDIAGNELIEDETKKEKETTNNRRRNPQRKDTNLNKRKQNDRKNE